MIGGGPAGLMAAEELAKAGHDVTVYDAKPSFGRKFLMAGKSGLNLTKDEPDETLIASYAEAAPRLRPMIASFGSQDIVRWAEDLGQPVFVGSTGRVFPTVMKASPLLRAWLGRLSDLGVILRTRHKWVGWSGEGLSFETSEGINLVQPAATVLALGGASWARLGSDGAWVNHLTKRGVEVDAFLPANAGVRVQWSKHMLAVLGQPLKNVLFKSGPYRSRGEAILSARGLEGGGIYSVSRGVRDGYPLEVDILPDMAMQPVIDRLSRPRGKMSMSNMLRKSLRLSAPARALLHEFAHPLPQDPRTLAGQIKSLIVRHDGLRPLDEAISSAGGVRCTALDEGLMLKALPGVFCAGEMLDWEAPTGGYLLTACLATGRWAGQHAARYLDQRPR